MKTYLIYFCLGVAQFSMGQVNKTGALNTGLLNSNTAYATVFSTDVNPSLITCLDKSSIGINYSNRFLMKGLQSQSLQFNTQFFNQHFAFNLNHYGSNLYRDISFGVSYALPLSDKFSAGITLRYRNINIGNRMFTNQRLEADLGLIYSFSDKLSFATSFLNINSPRTGGFYEDRKLTQLNFGVCKDFEGNISLLASLAKGVRSDLVLSTGMLYKYKNTLKFFGSVDFQKWSYGFGFSYKVKSFEIQLSMVYSTLLSWSPNSSFICYGKAYK